MGRQDNHCTVRAARKHQEACGAAHIGKGATASFQPTACCRGGALGAGAIVGRCEMGGVGPINCLIWCTVMHGVHVHERNGQLAMPTLSTRQRSVGRGRRGLPVDSYGAFRRVSLCGLTLRRITSIDTVRVTPGRTTDYGIPRVRPRLRVRPTRARAKAEAGDGVNTASALLCSHRLKQKRWTSVGGRSSSLSHALRTSNSPLLT